MRYVVLLFNRIKQYYVNRKLLFILLFAVGLINSLVFIYLYGNLRPIMANRSRTDFFYRQYSVYFSAERTEGGVSIFPSSVNYVSSADLKKIISSDLFDSVVLTDYSHPERPEELSYADQFSSCVYGTPNIAIVSGRKTLSSDDEILISNNVSGNVGDRFFIKGKEFTVIGVFSGKYQVLMTPSAYQELSGETSILSVTSKDRWHSGYSEEDMPADLLGEIFPEAILLTPEDREYTDEADSVFGLQDAVICYVIETIAFILLLSYVLKALDSENSVSVITGAQHSSVLALCSAEAVIISIIPIICSIIIHQLLYSSFFEKLNSSGGIVYQPEDYLMICLTMICALIVMLIPTFVRIIRRPPYELHRSQV